jgi:hypothetical protein
MRKVRHLFFLTVGIFFSAFSFAQSVTPAILNSTGGTNFFTFYRFEWSFGEAVAIETMPTSNLIVTNGVMQPGTEFPANVNNTGGWGLDEIRILPNPTQNWLEIDFFSKQSGKVTMNLFDESGRFMGNQQFDYYGVGVIKKWNFDQFASGAYFLNIQLQPTGTSVAKKGTYQVQKIK